MDGTKVNPLPGRDSALAVSVNQGELIDCADEGHCKRSLADTLCSVYVLRRPPHTIVFLIPLRALTRAVAIQNESNILPPPKTTFG